MSLKSMLPEENSAFEAWIFDQRSRLLLVILAILFALAVWIRLDHIKAPGILVEREYTSAIFARTFYFEQSNSVETWRKEIARLTKKRQPVLEPPVTEFLVALIYRVVGKEQLWYARFLTSAFWIIGGFFFYKVAEILLSTGAALVATAYYLFVPLGVLVSRSFQPDSLMMMMFLISLFCILRYFDRPSMPMLILAAIISGLTLLFRPLVLFAIFGAFISLSIYKKGSWKQVVDRPFLIFTLVSLFLPVAYYGYGIFVGGFLRWKVDSSFRPYLFLRREFWREWFLLGVSAVTSGALIAAFLGASLLRNGLARALVVGLSIGYFVFGLAFPFHIHTHGYYHLQLILIVAICAAPLVAAIVDQLKYGAGKMHWLSVVAALLVILFFGIQDIRTGLNGKFFESEKTAREIGSLVQHSDRTVFLAYHYGLPLEYYGELSGTFWSRSITSLFYRRPGERELSVEERLKELGFSPEYFVITNFDDYRRNHRDLQAFLTQNCSVLADTDRYLVYQSCVY